MKQHELRTSPPFFQHILDGVKTFDIRAKDSSRAPFRVGDVLWLREWTGIRFTDRDTRRVVSYIYDGDEALIPQLHFPGMVIMGIIPFVRGR